MNVGIIGYGSFGKLLADTLSKKLPVSVHDKDKKVEENKNIKTVGLEQISKCDVIILAVNLNSLEDICAQLANKVSENTIVVEVCSSKTKSIEILQKHLGKKCQYVATHPLFGPQSMNETSRKIVICASKLNNKSKIYGLIKYGLNLEIIEMSAEEHDKQMAWIHGLTFFVGRGLKELNLSDFELKTGYYQKLLDLVELENQHSIELFNTVQEGNPYSKEVREQFVKKLQDINLRLDKEEK